MTDEQKEMIIYLSVALGVLITGLYLYRKEILFIFKKKEAEGTIVNWMSSTEKGKRYYYPLIEFVTEDRGSFTFRADERCEGSPMFEPGTKVVVKYLPNDPEFRKVVYPQK